MVAKELKMENELIKMDYIDKEKAKIMNEWLIQQNGMGKQDLQELLLKMIS